MKKNIIFLFIISTISLFILGCEDVSEVNISVDYEDKSQIPKDDNSKESDSLKDDDLENPNPLVDLESPKNITINLNSLSSFTRVSTEPILEDMFNGYGFASDIHVFESEGQIYGIYSGSQEREDDSSSIKLATSTDYINWEKQGVLLGSDNPSDLDYNKETAFYRYSESRGKHQIYYIGYVDEDEYASQIFLTESDSPDGPYIKVNDNPIIPLGIQAGRDVKSITSPSIVEYEGTLYIAYCAWDAPHEAVTEVWIIGATSTDGGLTWSNYQEVNVPVCMEGQLTIGPDGKFYSLGTVGDESDGVATFTLARADHPFGPYESVGTVLKRDINNDFEKEFIAPQITFDTKTNKAYLYYAGADYAIGWWIMIAEATYTPE